MSKMTGKVEKTGIFLSIAACFMLFLYSPLELFFTNVDEFWFDFYILFPVMAVVFVLMCGLSILFFAVLHKIGKRAYHIGMLLYFWAFVSAYIQGNFLTAGLPPLDGTSIDWSQYSAERIKSLIVWAVVLAAVLAGAGLLKMPKMLKVIKGVSIFMPLMLGVTLVTLGISNRGFEVKPSMSTTTRNMFEMSEDTNFVILLLDALDAEVVNGMMEEKPEYCDIFTDFTFYRNTVSAYPYTKHSIPYILSGDWYENDEPFREYVVNAYARSPLFEKLEQNGYKMGIYDAELLLDDGGMARFENMLANGRGVTSYFAFARWQVLMTGFRYAPFDLKRICFVNPDAFNNLKQLPEGYSLFTPSNTDFYDGIKNVETTYARDKCFRFIHIDGGHVPFRYDEEVNVIENGTYEDNVRACLTITRTYLNKLKEAGVYDNSVIIVMADHGYNWEVIQGRQNPILFIKGVGENHDFQISDAPISFVDLQEAYSRLIDGTDSTEVFDYQEGDQRERRFLFYEYLGDAHMTEYIQYGQARDLKQLKATGREFIAE